MTKNQKEFLLNYFFKNEEYPGWRNIAEILIEQGECIVAGTAQIWRGGVGNFIRTEQTDRAVGCLLYIFEKEQFLSSAWFREIHFTRVEELTAKKKQIEEEFNKISAL